MTRIPHTQTQSGVGRGGGYPPGTVAPPEGRWSAAELPEMIPIIQRIRRLMKKETHRYVSSHTNPRCPVASLIFNENNVYNNNNMNVIPPRVHDAAALLTDCHSFFGKYTQLYLLKGQTTTNT